MLQIPAIWSIKLKTVKILNLISKLLCSGEIFSDVFLHLCLFFPLQDEYQFCYHAALEYLGSFDHYAT